MSVLLPPIILIPGVCGSKLDAVNRKTEKVERAWVSKDILPVPHLGKKFVHYLWGRPDPETHLYTSYTNDYAETRVVDGLKGCWRLIDHWFVNGLEVIFKNAAFGKYFVTIIGRLMRDYGYQPNKSLFGFSYDWRQPLYTDAIVGELHRLIMHVREVNNGMPVNIIAHSLGGLVGKTYCQMYPEWMINIRRFITIGTPFDGSSSMTLSSFINGFALNIPGMKLVTARGIQASSSVTLYLSNSPPPLISSTRSNCEGFKSSQEASATLDYLSNGLPYSTHFCNSCLYLKKISKPSKKSIVYIPRGSANFGQPINSLNAALNERYMLPGSLPKAPASAAAMLFDPSTTKLALKNGPSADENYRSSQFDTDNLIPEQHEIVMQDRERSINALRHFGTAHHQHSHSHHQQFKRVSVSHVRQFTRGINSKRASAIISRVAAHHKRLHSDTSDIFHKKHIDDEFKRHSDVLQIFMEKGGSSGSSRKYSFESAIFSQQGSSITLKQNMDAPQYTGNHTRSPSSASSAGSRHHTSAKRHSKSLRLSDLYITLDFSRYKDSVPDLGAILLGRFLSDPTIIADHKKKDVYQILMRSIERKVILKTIGIKKPRASGKSLDTLLLPNYKAKASLPAVEGVINAKKTWKWEAYSMWSHLGRSNASNVALHPYFQISEAGFPLLRDDCPYKSEIVSGILPNGGSFSSNKDLFLIASAQAIYTSTRHLTEPLYRTVLIDEEEKIVRGTLLDLEYVAPDEEHLVKDAAIYKADTSGTYIVPNKNANNKHHANRRNQKVRKIQCQVPVPWAFLADVPEQPLYGLLRQVTKLGTLEAYLFQPFKGYWKSVARNKVKEVVYSDFHEDVGSSQIMARGDSVFPMFTTVIPKDTSITERFTVPSMASLSPSASYIRANDSLSDLQEARSVYNVSPELTTVSVSRKTKQDTLRFERYLKRDDGDPRRIPPELIAEYPILSMMKVCTADTFRFISINGGNVPTPMHTIYSKPINSYDELSNQLPVFIMGRGDGTVLLTGALSDNFDDALVHDRVVVPNVAHFDLMHDQAVFYLVYMGLGLPLQIPSTPQNQSSNENENEVSVSSD